MIAQRQLELEFPDPYPLPESSWKNINLGKSESRYILVIEQPRFHWITGKWKALANIQGALCLIELSTK